MAAFFKGIETTPQWAGISAAIGLRSGRTSRNSMVPKDMSSSIILALSAGASGKLLTLHVSTFTTAYRSQKINKNLQAGRDWEEK